jgi:hypothetical protein
MNKKMKTILASAVIVCAAPLPSGAQAQLPNADFETWAMTADNVDSLAGWTSSSAVVLRPVISLYKDTSAYQAAHSARLVTAPFGFVQYSTIGILVNGSAQLSYGGGGGGANVAYVSGGGTPIAVKPSEFRCYYKYETLAASDHGLVRVLLTKYNTTLQRRDTVSIASSLLMPQPGYVSLVLPLPDRMPGVIPDTITTIFYSSDPATVAPRGVFSDLNIDSITLFTAPPSTTVMQLGNINRSIDVYPNPGTGLFMLKKNDDEQADINVCDAAGKNILHLSMSSRGIYTADLRNYPAGIYYLSAGDRPLSTLKVVINR